MSELRMPILCYTCPKCGKPDKKLLTVEQASQLQTCRKTDGCDGVLARCVRIPTVVQREVMDNGIQVKAVERDVDGAALADDRAHKDLTQR